MEKDLSEAITKGYDFVRFTIADIHGIARCKTVPKSGFRRFFETGTGMYVGAIGIGLQGELGSGNEVNSNQKATKLHPYCNLHARPVAGTLHPLPYCGNEKYLVGEILCETFHITTGTQQEELPRYIARQQLERLETLGYQLFSSFELEFVLVHPETLKPVFQNSGELFANLNLNDFDPVLLEVASMLDEMGVEVDTLQTEYAPGQFELVLRPQLGIKIADNVFLAKDCIKEVAKRHGLKAVFMTKVDRVNVCNSLHYNHSLRHVKQNDETSAFSDVTGDDKLSALCRAWIGGLTHHFRALVAMCNPTFNCHRRLGKPWAPEIANWGIDNRMTSFRVKNETPEVTYIESRLPGSACNPYLVVASTVASGIDGIVHDLSCPPPSPIPDTRSGVYTEMERSKVPLTLAESLQALQEDTHMVNSLGKDFIEWLVLLKKGEIKHLDGCDVNNDDPDMFAKERDLYMNLI